MKGYRTFKTTLGHKIRVKMTPEEIAERDLFFMAITVLPFAATILMGIIYFSR